MEWSFDRLKLKQDNVQGLITGLDKKQVQGPVSLETTTLKW
jgi:hypothetical protein